MRNANPRDGEIGRSWGKWFHRKAEQRTAMVHAHERAMAASDAAIQAMLIGRPKPPAARMIVGEKRAMPTPIGRPGLGTTWFVANKQAECPCGCKGDPFICIEADGS